MTHRNTNSFVILSLLAALGLQAACASHVANVMTTNIDQDKLNTFLGRTSQEGAGL